MDWPIRIDCPTRWWSKMRVRQTGAGAFRWCRDIHLVQWWFHNCHPLEVPYVVHWSTKESTAKSRVGCDGWLWSLLELHTTWKVTAHWYFVVTKLFLLSQQLSTLLNTPTWKLLHGNSTMAFLLLSSSGKCTESHVWSRLFSTIMNG